MARLRLKKMIKKIKVKKRLNLYQNKQPLYHAAFWTLGSGWVWMKDTGLVAGTTGKTPLQRGMGDTTAARDGRRHCSAGWGTPLQGGMGDTRRAGEEAGCGWLACGWWRRPGDWIGSWGLCGGHGLGVCSMNLVCGGFCCCFSLLFLPG